MNDVRTFIEENTSKQLLRISTAGSVDDGKSTLIGRLLADSKNIYEDHLSSLKKLVRDDEAPDLALLLDGLKAEREQGITIDVAYRYFSTPKRKFIIADTPGHEQYTRNMATGASTANLSIVLVDARNGVLTQSRRHAFIASLLGISHIIVAVNKMDLVGYEEATYESIKQDFLDYAAKLNITDIRVIPVSALNGDNVVSKSSHMPWYTGQSILEILEDVQFLSDRNMIDLRFPVQYVLRPNQDFRSYAGTVASGVIRPGDEILVLPGQIRSRVKSIVTYDGDLELAFPPMSISMQLEDEVDVSRGDMIVHPNNLPRSERHFEAMVVWMDETPMNPGGHYAIKHATQTARVHIDHMEYSIDVDTLHKKQAGHLALNEIGRVALTTVRPLFFDPYSKNRQTGCFILSDYLTNHTVGAGMIIDRLPGDRTPRDVDRIAESAAVMSGVKSSVSTKDRRLQYGQDPCTIWLTGLVGSGKSEIAFALEKALQEQSFAVVVLDGATVRSGLSRDLGFSAPDQAEHLRRVAEMSRILNDNGLIVIASFLSPSEEIRQQVAALIGKDRYVEVFVEASVAWCKAHDTSGCYDLFQRGELKNLAGMDYPYEAPESPDLKIAREYEQDGASVRRILEHLEESGKLDPRHGKGQQKSSSSS
ncbi:MAG: sulfate adenylyltransferase subunit CysN [Candidatus Latescibacteria bacterium]|nr:sulfate adenylyltransferase subunit CysN [Candidatus Latescibacterota bacterium]